MNPRRIGLPVLGIVLVALTGCAAASVSAAQTLPPPSIAEARVDSLMAVYDRPDSPGASVLVFRGEETLFSRGYGMANLEYDAPITPATVFHVASVSKQFTAIAIAMLAAEGRLSLDDDVREHIPELADFGERITLRHLLTHTSGLRDQWNLWVLAGGRMDDVIRQEDLFRLVTRQRELNFPAGAEYLYSNSGYMLAAKVVERVTGEPFGEWLRANVFQPLGMESTQVYDDHERLVPGRSYSYRGGPGEGFRKAVLSYANSGATSLFTTTEDLARWLRNFGHGRVGGTEVTGVMRERGVLTDGDTIAYALGVMMDEQRGLEMIQHGGADAGYRSYVAYYPALDAGVVVLSNLASFNPGGMARAVAEVFFGEHMDAEAPDSRAGSGAAGSRDDAAGHTPSRAELREYTGRYYSPELETLYTVALDDDGLVARHRRHGDIPLTPEGPDEFTGRQWFFGAVTFERDVAGAVTGMRVSSGRVRNLWLEKVDAPAEPGAQPAARELVREQHSGIEERVREVVRSGAEWTRTWARIHANRSEPPPLPAVDFDRSVVVVASMGARSSGGHTIGVERVRDAGSGVSVLVRETSPARGCMVTAAITHPVVAVQVSGTEDEITFEERTTVRDCP